MGEGMECTVSKKGVFAIFSLADRIEWEDARHIDETVRRLITEGTNHLAFDLNRITYICSAGIGALVYNLNTVKKKGGAIYIITANEYIDYLFQTLKFDMIFEGHIFQSMDEFTRRVIEEHGNA
jgi:anti-anti-sigma factor